ncbi:DUF2726 domain-containing protein [Roseateles sp.]|uniref:DUF2726 domain-containing protein n=1 Tax=Roseateles sp. TaxID=1971397 RepID=UPI00393B575F
MLNLNLPRAVGAWLNNFTISRSGHADATDTVLLWPPSPTRVLASAERIAHKHLSQVLALEHPKGYLLTHVPLFKVVKVPKQHSYREWLSRTGLLTVDFVLCDEHGYVRSVVLMPTSDDDARLIRKRDRLLRVLEASGLTVAEWQRDWTTEDRQRLCDRVFPKTTADASYVDAPHAH